MAYRSRKINLLKVSFRRLEGQQMTSYGLIGKDNDVRFSLLTACLDQFVT